MTRNQNIYNKQQQRLVMTLGMRQAIEVLQMPTCELSDWLSDQINQNPLLEPKSNSTYIPEYPQNEAAVQETLDDFLKKEFMILFSSQTERAIAEKICGFLDHRGFLTSTHEDIATFCGTHTKTIESVAYLISQLDPPGIAALNVQHSLLLQLEKKNSQNSLAYRIIQNHWDWLIQSKHTKLCQHYKIKHQELLSLINNEIRLLNPSPGSIFQPSENRAITIDLEISDINGQLYLEDADAELPKFEIQSGYLKQVADEPFVRSWLARGKWLNRIISRRNQLLKKVGHLIIKHQKQYLLGVSASPSFLSFADMADELEISYTTATRILKNKFISTPRGILPLGFFTTGVKLDKDHHIDSVFQALLSCVQSEDKNAPLSDLHIAEHLSKNGIEISRRTVAKYRAKLNIPSVFSRKQISS